ncbi:MAG: VWA domain-containing protein [Candidatus Hermodarchaeota archaeon]
MHDIKIEDTVILIDSSRSMLRNDFKPNRLVIAIETIKNFISSKLDIDINDRISIICFGESIKKLNDFSSNKQQLLNSLGNLQMSGKGVIQEAIAFSLQLHVGEMRKLGGKIHRIFIISDNKLDVNSEQLDEIIDVSKGLGIFIDTCQIGKPPGMNQNILKRISYLTNGEYGYFNNERAIINAGKSYASKKMIKQSSDYFSANSKEKAPPLVNEIALSLRRPTVMEMRMMMKDGGKEQEKCQICHSVKAPTGADFYAEGRFCPNCERPMHLSCANMWAKKSEQKENLFRCPFCYFLLKVPKTISKLVQSKVDDFKKIRIIEDDGRSKTRMIEIHSQNINQIDESCTYCHNIFLGEYKVFKCQNCGSHYHEPCLQKMYNELKACRFCGAEIIIE